MSAVAAAARSGRRGCGLAARNWSRARSKPVGVASWRRLAVKTIATGMSRSSASLISICAASTRASQSGALAQPLSMTRARGPFADSARSRGLRTGSARARITSAAISKRRAVSHQGLRAGVSSGFKTRARMASGANGSACGRGGVSRSSHQITGRASNPNRIAGAPKAKGRPAIMRMPPSWLSECPRDDRGLRQVLRTPGGRCGGRESSSPCRRTPCASVSRRASQAWR
jgi:hypothetical protein